MIEDKRRREARPANELRRDRWRFPRRGGRCAPAGGNVLRRFEGELADTKDRLLRALAETENVRGRPSVSATTPRKYRFSGFARILLATADNLRRALDQRARGRNHDVVCAAARRCCRDRAANCCRCSKAHGLSESTRRRAPSTTNFHQGYSGGRGRIPAAGTSSRCCSRAMCSMTRLPAAGMVRRR